MTITDPEKKVQCTTCRLTHFKGTRVWVRQYNDPRCHDECCPKCGGKVTWMILKNPIKRRLKARNAEEWRASYEEPGEGQP